MKFASVAVLFAACLTPAASASIWDISVTDEKPRIPGDNPLTYCNEDRASDLVVIEKVDLSPNPPRAGTELVVNASGTVKETIEQGAYVKLVVKYGLIRLLTTTVDFCEQIGNVDLECPIKKGSLTVAKSIDLPQQIPPGTYNVNAQVYTNDDRLITCLDASVKFSRGGAAGFFGNDL